MGERTRRGAEYATGIGDLLLQDWDIKHDKSGDANKRGNECQVERSGDSVPPQVGIPLPVINLSIPGTIGAGHWATALKVSGGNERLVSAKMLAFFVA